MKWISVVIALIIIAGGAWLLFGPQSADSPAIEEAQITDDTSIENADENTDNSSVEVGVEARALFTDDEPTGDPIFHALVTYAGNGFEPATVTVRKGETVRFVNQAASGMWVGSDNHPTHTQYDGTSTKEHCTEGAAPTFDTCRALEAGEFWEFTFDRVGEWGYHNHVRARDTGTIVVVEE